MNPIKHLVDKIFGPAESYRTREYRQATERWQQFNTEQRAAGCRCGKPATEVRYNRGNNGAVPVEYWTCIEHAGVGSWAGYEGHMRPFWPRSTPCDTCDLRRCGVRSGMIDGRTDTWHCPDSPGGGPTTWRESYVPGR